MALAITAIDLDVISRGRSHTLGNSINDPERVLEVLKIEPPNVRPGQVPTSAGRSPVEMITIIACRSGLPLTIAANGRAGDEYIQPCVACGIEVDGHSL